MHRVEIWEELTFDDFTSHLFSPKTKKMLFGPGHAGGLATSD